MKIVTAVTFLLLMLATCQKETINPEASRFLKSRIFDSTGNSIYYSFEYNFNGSVTKVLKSVGNEPGVLFADILYRGNEIVVVPVPLISEAVEANSEIRFVIDSSGRPLKRIEHNYEEFKEPVNIPQKDYKTDSALFEYNIAGLLVKERGFYHDSTWFNPGTVQTYNTDGKYESNYSNSSGTVFLINRIANEQSRVVNGTQVFNSSRSIEETNAFEYSHAYLNKTDFSHAILLREFNLLFDKVYPLCKGYDKVPDRIIMSRVTRDEYGKTINTEEVDTKITIAYNSYGLISSMTFYPGNEARKEIIYGY